ncbi:MAG TPA: 50S ribosomal protein L25 [Planctomycetota bacterium]|nr:50S ribosomal protein L25 [Planctomycetota bacterium]
MPKPSVLKTHPRSGTGSAAARRMRAASRVPVNVYGHGEANQNLALEEHDLELALHTATQVFTLSIGGKEQPCLVKSVQYDTFGQRVLHVDFARVSLTEEVEVEVALEIAGTPKGVAEGGQVVVLHPALWVRCLASAIPDSLPVDITPLLMGQAIHAREIALPAGVTLDTKRMNPDDQIVAVAAPRIEAAPVEAAPAAAEGAVAPAAEGAAPVAGAAPPAAEPAPVKEKKPKE